MSRARYADRQEAGQHLAEQLATYAGRDDVLVVGLPRGGVPVAAAVAAALGTALDVVVVRKLGLPSQPELAMGAITAVGEAVTIVRNDAVIDGAGISAADFDGALAAETAELRRREALYRGENPPVPLTGQTVIVVDDGLATGSSMRAAIAALRTQEPARLVAAVPVAAAGATSALEADELVCGWAPERLSAVGQAYESFAQTSDDEVRRLLDESGSR